MLGFVDGMLAELVDLADREDLVQAAQGVFLQRHGEGENLEHRTQFIDVLGHDVAAGVFLAERALVGFEKKKKKQHQQHTKKDNHHDAAGGGGREGVARRLYLMRQD